MKTSLSKISNKGFTLIEILIVVIIVGLLAGVAVVKLGDSKERAVISVKKNIATELNKAIQASYVNGNILSFTNGNDAAAVVAVLTELQTQSPAPFTSTSEIEMAKGINDNTTGTGSWEVTGGPGHRDVEVVYTAPVTP